MSELEALATPPPIPPPSRTAKAALLLGLVGVALLGPITGLPAVILGHLARRKTVASGDTKGFREATIGMWMGYSTILLLPVLLFLLWVLYRLTIWAGLPVPWL